MSQDYEQETSKGKKKKISKTKKVFSILCRLKYYFSFFRIPFFNSDKATLEIYASECC